MRFSSSSRFVGFGVAALSILAFSFVACGGGDDDANGDDPGSSGGASGTLPDGAPFPSGDGATGADANVPLTAKQACEQYIDAACTRLTECGQPQNCEPLKKLCPANYLGEGMPRTQDQLLACAAQRRTQSCAEIRAGIDLPCVVNGTIPGGEACHFNSQCQSGRCNSGARGACGSCYPLVGLGEACDEEHFCAVNVRCDQGTCHAIPPVPAPLPAGSACSDTAPCVDEAPCSATGPGQQTGTCTPVPPAGAPCGFTLYATNPSLCAAPAYCRYATAAGTEGTCTTDRVPLGSPCGAVEGYCDPANNCTGDPLTCKPKPAQNEPCQSDYECVEGLFCSYPSATCQPRGGVSAACTDSSQCTPDLGCGTAPGSDAGTTCVNVAGLGEPCGAPNQICYGDLLCENGACALGACAVVDAGAASDAGP